MSDETPAIFVRAWRGLIKPLYSYYDSWSKAIFVLFALLSLLSLCFRFEILTPGGPNQNGANVYQQYYWAWWYAAWGLLVLSTVNPLIAAFDDRKRNPLPLFIACSLGLLLVFVSMGLVVLSDRVAANTQAVTTLVAALAAAAMVGVGWAVQSELLRRGARRAHTFNVIVQSRLSKEYQQHVRNREPHFPSCVKISKEDAAYASARAFAEKMNPLREELAKERAKPDPERDTGKISELEQCIECFETKYAGLEAVRSIMNFYEFVAAGLHTGDLDEELLARTFKGMLVQLYDDTEEVVNHFRTYGEGHPKAFCELQTLANSWRSD